MLSDLKYMEQKAIIGIFIPQEIILGMNLFTYGFMMSNWGGNLNENI